MYAGTAITVGKPGCKYLTEKLNVEDNYKCSTAVSMLFFCKFVYYAFVISLLLVIKLMSTGSRTMSHPEL